MFVEIPETIAQADTATLLSWRASAFREMGELLQTQPDSPEFETLMVLVAMIDLLLTDRNVTVQKE